MYRAVAFAASLSLFCEAVSAENLGVRGAVFLVAEPDLFAKIAAKFERLEKSGEVDAVNERLNSRALAMAERPTHVEGIIATTAPRSFHYDPTVTLKEDIVTPGGQVIARAGERFNPLDYTPMRQHMIFFDGDDPVQVAWAKLEIGKSEALVSPILVAGPVLDLSRDWGRQVFFDQGGKLTGTFGVTQVPARISRDGDLLLVEEVAP
jgi:conjugal transfer pilus assembly protein TraW